MPERSGAISSWCATRRRARPSASPANCARRPAPATASRSKAPSRKAPRRRSVTQYVLDFTKCSLCGSCVEACRDGAIRYSHEYNLASTNKEDYVMDLFKRLEDERLAPKPEVQTSPAPPVVAQASRRARERLARCPRNHAPKTARNRSPQGCPAQS